MQQETFFLSIQQHHYLSIENGFRAIIHQSAVLSSGERSSETSEEGL